MLKTFFQNLPQQRDLILILVFGLILMMMILPLPTVLMDLLITLNISAGIIILLVALALHTPVQLSTFPAILLVTTLFRLAISISTTRLILIEGDAGMIVETFGKVVISGNLVVGLVIFLIITVVQFLVITKGADRVAEVGARFTLDGMPGKQMSVDADVRAGTMNQMDAKAARGDLEREAKLFGAMDGAMKFVKGDAIAALVITVINLLGGITIGMAQLGMDFSDALSLYALLTIGDGLVAQIPALLIAVAAGTIVTRVTNPTGTDLSTEISEQITQNRRTMMSAGVVIAAFGFVPGFPTLIFMAVGLSMTGTVFWLTRQQKKDDELLYTDWVRMYHRHSQDWENLRIRTGRLSSVHLKLPSVATQEVAQSFYENFEGVRQSMGLKMGFQPGYWSYDIENTHPTEYEIYIHQELVARGSIDPNCFFVKANASYLTGLGIPVAQHFGPEDGCLVHRDHKEALDEFDIVIVGTVGQVLNHVVSVVVENMAMFAGYQQTTQLLRTFSKSHGALISELKENLTVTQISRILQMLLEERIPIANTIRIFESILDNAAKREDLSYVLQKVRVALTDFISNRYAEDGFLPVVVVSPNVEAMLREAIRSNGEDSYLVLEPNTTKALISQMKSYVRPRHNRFTDPVFITQQDIRRSVRNLLHENGLYVPVLAYQEVNARTVIYPMGFIASADQSAQAQGNLEEA